EADIAVHDNLPQRARAVYTVVLREAQRMGGRAIECFVLFKMAELSIELGDAEGARRSAMQALKISNANGLGLLTTRILIVLARATHRGGDRELGLGYLRIAEQRARRQNYGFRLREVERYLQDENLLRDF